MSQKGAMSNHRPFFYCLAGWEEALIFRVPGPTVAGELLLSLRRGKIG